MFNQSNIHIRHLQSLDYRICYSDLFDFHPLNFMMFYKVLLDFMKF